MYFIIGLPEDCISRIISLISPRDACRTSAASRADKFAADSDSVWKWLLPDDYEDIIARSVSRIEFSSKKELFFRLCDPIVIDGGRMSFSLEKMTGKKCYMLSARKLSIVWSEDHRYWKWITLPESRFPEVAELLRVCWLEIRGRIDVRALSPETTYKAYLVLQISAGARGLDHHPATTTVNLGTHESQDTVLLQQHTLYLRPDGWMEIELGEFFSGAGNEGDVEMGLQEIIGGHWKRGLIIEGIEIRPA